MRVNVAWILISGLVAYIVASAYTPPARSIGEARQLAAETSAYLGYLDPGGCGVGDDKLLNAKLRLVATLHNRPDLVPAMLRDSDLDTKSAAICLVGQERLGKYAPILSDIYELEEDPVIRLQVIQAMAYLGGDVAVRTLRQALSDDATGNWVAAAQSLKALGETLDRKIENRMVFETAILR